MISTSSPIFRHATLNSTGSNSTTAGDGEDVLNRHQERLVSLTFRGRDVVVNSIHQVEDALVLRSVDVLGRRWSSAR